MSIQLPSSLNFITRFISPYLARCKSLETRSVLDSRLHPRRICADGVERFPTLTVAPVVRGMLAQWRTLKAWAIFSVPMSFFPALPWPGFMACASAVDDQRREVGLHASTRETGNSSTSQTKSYIEGLMSNPALFNPVRAPRNPIVLWFVFHFIIY